MVGALIDTGNPLIPFIGGIIVGGLIGPPLIDAAGGLLGGMVGSDADAAYAYHAYKHGHGGMGHMHGHGMHRHGMGRHAHGSAMGHEHFGHGMMHHQMPVPHHGPSRATKGHSDFGLGYTNIEQTFTNHVNIRH